jgi:hypothetical protein
LTLTVVVAGCGGGGSSTGSTAAPSTASTPSAGSSSAGTGSQAPDPNATEHNPPGDIPDDQVFVAYSPPAAPFSVKVPEGWARSTDGAAVTFTDKLNSIRMETLSADAAPTVASARRDELPALESSVPKYAPGDVTMVTRAHGKAVRLTYLADSPPDPVTDKVVRDAVERYEFWRAGTEVVLTLSGPKGADNVDPWRIVSDSLAWK